MEHNYLQGLTPEATLGDLQLDNVRVSPDDRAEVIDSCFKQRSDLAGVLVVHDTSLMGVVSADWFLRHMTRPFFPEIYTHRPIRMLLELLEHFPLRLPCTMGVHEAAHLALQRPRELMGEPVVVEMADGDVRLLSMTVLLLSQSRLLGMANEIIREQKEAADAANRAKSEFLANMSHEIRTPMNGVIGLTDILLESETNEERREHLTMVKNSADWLVSVINDILDFSKIEAGKLDLEEVDFPLRDTLLDLIRPLEFRARAKGLALVCHCEHEVPDQLIGDAVRLRQILINLISNALKFTAHGEIDLRVGLKERLDNRVVLHFSVRDTGIGVPADKVEKIFRSFEQADGSTSRRYGGTGLGLSICARLVQMMNGRIWLESEAGQGATFHFTAALGCGDGARSRLAEENPPRQSGAWGLRILLAEDNPVNQTLAVLLLEKRGHELTVVDNGQLAIAALERGEFDLVLMDVQMPVMDGIDATRHIRQSERDQNRHIPIVAMTAHALKGDRERCLETGMDGYVSKPIAAERLYAAIDEVMAPRQEGRARESQTSRTTEPTPPKVSHTAHDVDWTVALAQMGGSRNVLRQVVEAFLKDERCTREDIRKALAANDGKEVRRLAHSLKGTLGLFGAAQAQDTAYRLEMIGKSGDLDDAETAFRELSGQLERITPELEGFLQHDRRAATAAERQTMEGAVVGGKL